MLHQLTSLLTMTSSVGAVAALVERLLTMPTRVARKRAEDRLMKERYDRERELIEPHGK